MKQRSRPTSVPANPELWSEDSKRSYIYDSPPGEYKDHQYECMRCKQPSVFTAQDQRETYEVRKAYIWQKRTLCEECHGARLELEARLREQAQRWQSSKHTLQSDRLFLQEWLVLLEDHVRFGASANEANMRMLRKLLAENEA